MAGRAKPKPAPELEAVEATERGLVFQIVTDNEIEREINGERVVLGFGDRFELDDPVHAWQLITAGIIHAVDDDGELLDPTDQAVLIDFAHQGVKFDPAEWKA